MKAFLLSVFLLVSMGGSSQVKNVSLQTIKTNDKIITGSLDKKYNITMYLKVENYSEDHMYAFSLKGWYYYDNVKKPIPLVGISNPAGDLTLFNVTDKVLEKKILDFDFPGNGTWEKLDAIESFKGFNEKFIISDTKEGNTWESGSKKLSFTINNPENHFLIDDIRLLKIGNTTVNLSKYSINHDDLKIVSKKITPNEVRVLFQYEDMGNPNVQGQCGGATDSGYIILTFNNKTELTYLSEIQTDNCRSFIYSEPIKTNDNKLLKLKITESMGDKETFKTITIDTESVTFIK